MTRPPAILITECLQHDFVRPIGRHEPLPNLLHIGYEEARRLHGETVESGPLARTLAWAHARPASELLVVHVRDWHAPEESAQASHMSLFGGHCLHESEGAGFVFALPPAERGGVEVIDSATLNDFAGTRLSDVLAPFAGTPARVGLMGVWTEAKITFLAYELATRLPAFDLAVCSALTASSSRAQHYLALDQLAKLLGVRVLGSIGEFTEFLVPGSRPVALPDRAGSRFPALQMEGDLALGPGDTELARYLFRESRRVRLQRLTAGFSGSLVLAARGEDAYGHREAPHVLKIGPREAVGRERAAFERIESVLGNSAPRITEVAERGDRGAIKYRYASMGGGDSTTFQRLYSSGADIDRVCAVLRTVFVEQLGTLYEAASREKCDLLRYYEFSPRWAEDVTRRVEAVTGQAGQGDVLDTGTGRPWANPAGFYARDLAGIAAERHDTVSFAWVHGDLNGANIVIDARGNVWLIDFFHAHRGHVLRDLVKLENDLLYIFTPVDGPDTLREAARLTDALIDLPHLDAALPSAAELGVSTAPLVRAWQVVACLRGFYPALLQTDPDPWQSWVATLRYAVHTLGFEESGPWQKRWALYTAGRCVERIRERLSS